MSSSPPPDWINEIVYKPYLEFANTKILRGVKYKRDLSFERQWLSTYFRKEVLTGEPALVSIRWIDSVMGYGVFAEKAFAPMHFIAEYAGLVRKRSKHDNKNAYCFEYLLEPDEETPYLIDAENQGGVSRFINHSNKPNLLSAFVLVDEIPHIILYTSKRIERGEELTYDYGPDYWKKRPPPKMNYTQTNSRSGNMTRRRPKFE